ncbi:MAG: hypothetical protein V1736_08245 [Pseudomonadota bacterium]
MNLQQRIAVMAADILAIVELCLSMYLAHQDPANFTSVFMKSFFGMIIPTLVLAILTVRGFRTKAQQVGP